MTIIRRAFNITRTTMPIFQTQQSYEQREPPWSGQEVVKGCEMPMQAKGRQASKVAEGMAKGNE